MNHVFKYDVVEATALYADRTLGDIAAEVPGAIAIFRHHQLDFCCCGDLSLAEVARQRNLDLKVLETALATLRIKADEIPESTPLLIERIKKRYHETHRREVPALLVLAQQV